MIRLDGCPGGLGSTNDQMSPCWFVFVFNVPPTAKVMEMGPRLKVSSDRLLKPGFEPVTPGL